MAVSKRLKPIGPPTFKELIERGADLRATINAGAKAKLTPRAFLSAALKIADCDCERLDVVQQKLGTMGADAVLPFVNRLVREFRSPAWPGPHANTEKMVRAYGSESLPAQLLNLKVTAAECQALAARIAGERFPQDFGTVDNWDDHLAAMQSARDQFDQVLSDLRTSWTPDDVQLGGSQVTFLRFPDLHPGLPDWPTTAVERVLAERNAPPPKPLKREPTQRELEDAVQEVVYGLSNTIPIPH